MPVLNYPGVPGTTLYAGIPPAGGTVVSTITLVNTSGSTQAANFVSPMFGVPFKQGVMPSGQYPKFAIASGGAACPATLWNYSTWPDGSMMFCGAMIQVPSSIAGSGTLQIEVQTGGTAPAASGRTTADLTAANMIIEATGVTNLSGVWTSSLNDGITVADDFTLVADGAAGAIWRVGAEFRQSGSAHGQMYGTHYVAALNTSGGALRGLRYMGKASQPWTDIASPAATARVMVGVLKSGSTTLRTLQGTQSGETGTTNITMAHYSGWHTAGSDGKWDYVQGGGASSTDNTVRVTYDKAEFIATRLVPPYQTALNPTAPTAAPYRPYCIGGMTVRFTGATGERDDIGVLPEWVARHILNQHVNDEQTVRVSSLASAGWRCTLRRKSTRRILPTADTASSYTGLGTTAPTVRWFSGSAENITQPSSNTSLWSEEDQSHHRASTAYYAYLITGDPVHLDILQDYAAQIIASRWQGGPTWKTTMPVVGACATGNGERDATIQGGGTYKGGGTFFDIYGLRISAWMARDVGQAAAISPDTDVAKPFFTDVINNSFDAANDYNSRMPSTWRDAGFWTMEGPTEVSPAAWMNGYFSNAICHLASILSTTNSATFRGHLSKWYSAQHGLGRSVACFSSYHWSNRRGNTRIQTAAEMLSVLESRFTWNTTTERFTISASSGSGGNANGGWSPTAGDIFMFDPETAPGTRPFAGATNWTPMYVVNPSGQTGQVSLTPGGSVADVTSAADYSFCMAAVQNFSPNWSFNGFNDPSGYVANAYGAMRHHEACGDSTINSARVAMDACWASAAAASGSSFANEPKNAMAAAYPT